MSVDITLYCLRKNDTILSFDFLFLDGDCRKRFITTTTNSAPVKNNAVTVSIFLPEVTVHRVVVRLACAHPRMTKGL